VKERQRETSAAGYFSTCKNASLPDDNRNGQPRYEVEDKVMLTG